MMEPSGADMFVASIAVDANVISEVGFACTAEGLDCEDVAFFHSLGSLRLDEGYLLVAVNVVAQNVMASDIADCFYRDAFALQFDLVALHYFLDSFTDVIDPSIDTSFLSARVR